MTGNKISSFEQLVVWQESQNLAVDVYKISRDFPKEETFGVTSQIRRAASSVSANIAEGFGRSSAKDKLQFYTIAYGSLLETKNFLYLSEKLGYIEKQSCQDMIRQCTTVQKLLNAFMKPLKS
jgi:four helix bundle protein